jgi:hypothetical protein
VLSLYPNPLETKQHPFNELFISRNHIKSIVVEISTKREMDVIRSAHQFRVFDFDDDGHLVSEKKFKMSTSDSINIRYDTLSLSYNYNSDGKLTDRVEYMGKGFVKKYYGYDAKGQLQRLTTTQYDYKNPEKGRIISKDSIFTVQTKNMMVQRYINDYNRPYKEIRLMYDSLGYLYRYRNMYLISKHINTIDYKYNDMGLLKEVLFKYSEASTPTRKEVYEYDTFGFPEAQFIYVNDILKERKEYLFREDGSLKAILTKDMASNLITIWEMKYVE